MLAQRIRKLLALDWRVQFRHTWREGNRCVDWFVNFTFSLGSFKCMRMENLPSEFHRFIFNDIYGTFMSRNIWLVS